MTADHLSAATVRGNDRLSRSQWVVIGLWLGVPIILLILLMIINPAYEQWVFRDNLGFYPASLLLLLQNINGIALLFGFEWLNRRGRQPQPRRTANRILTSLLLIVTFVLLTLPSLWIVVFWPSMMILLTNTGPTFR